VAIRSGPGSINRTSVGSRTRYLMVIILVGLGFACATLEWKPLGPRRTQTIADTTRVGAEECATCHEDVQGHAKIASYHADCESCHGGGSLHATSEEVVDIRYPANGDCLGCHAVGRDTHLQWGTGDHSRGGVLCSDCHNPHATSVNHIREATEPGLPYMDGASAMCVQCHQDVTSRLRFPSHHPVGEGKMKCTSCHDPHEDNRLRVTSTSERCQSCHQDVAGPWIFEHPPVAEDCGLCHDPHGTITYNLQAMPQPALCLSCHTLNDVFHHDSSMFISQSPPAPGEEVSMTGAETFFRNCTNCHSAIHGSVTDEYLRH